MYSFNASGMDGGGRRSVAACIRYAAHIGSLPSKPLVWVVNMQQVITLLGAGLPQAPEAIVLENSNTHSLRYPSLGRASM